MQSRKRQSVPPAVGRATFRNFLRLACLGETPATPRRGGVSNSFVGASVSSRRNPGTRATTFPRVRAVGMLAVRATAVRATAARGATTCGCVFSHHRGHDTQVDRARHVPPRRAAPRRVSLFPSRSDVRFDRFHGWSARTLCSTEQNRARIATHCHFSGPEKQKAVGLKLSVLACLYRSV